MQSLLLQIVKELHRIEERIIDILMNGEDAQDAQEEGSPVSAIQEEPKEQAAQVDKDLKDSRVIWKSKEDFVDIFGIVAEYGEISPNVGLAYKKETWSRDGAWKSANRAWAWLVQHDEILRTHKVGFNALRKLHTKDWYIWFYDAQLAQKKWVSARIKTRREE